MPNQSLEPTAAAGVKSMFDFMKQLFVFPTLVAASVARGSVSLGDFDR